MITMIILPAFTPVLAGRVPTDLAFPSVNFNNVFRIMCSDLEIQMIFSRTRFVFTAQ
eukprot:COSAG02_NODE_9493_length_2198_cov_24.343927_3_plen_57_part_00